MRDILPSVAAWASAGVPFAMATVVQTQHSAPRPPGATMAVSATGEVRGSVSGGCVETAVHNLCTAAIATALPSQELFGASDDDVFAVGLTCGGSIKVVVVPVLPGTPQAQILVRLGELTASGIPVVLGASVDGQHFGELVLVTDEDAIGYGWAVDVSEDLVQDLRAMLVSGGTATFRYDGRGCRATAAVELAAHVVFAQSFVLPPHLIIFGALDFTAALARAGKLLGYKVTVCDARGVFATPARFPEADEVVVAWPHDYMAATTVGPSTAVCVLTHDPKFDIPILRLALASRAGYVGAMGSRRTHRDRVERLRAAGVVPEELSRLHSPIGLDLGGLTPEETAIAIVAEMVAVRRGGSGLPLSEMSGSIHHVPAESGADVFDVPLQAALRCSVQ